MIPNLNQMLNFCAKFTLLLVAKGSENYMLLEVERGGYCHRQ